eukprot:6207273-Pleurochrysis_carterae.AAC.1
MRARRTERAAIGAAASLLGALHSARRNGSFAHGVRRRPSAQSYPRVARRHAHSKRTSCVWPMKDNGCTPARSQLQGRSKGVHASEAARTGSSLSTASWISCSTAPGAAAASARSCPATRNDANLLLSTAVRTAWTSAMQSEWTTPPPPMIDSSQRDGTREKVRRGRG